MLTSMNAQRGALPADSHTASLNGMSVEYLTLAWYLISLSALL